MQHIGNEALPGMATKDKYKLRVPINIFPDQPPQWRPEMFERPLEQRDQAPPSIIGLTRALVTPRSIPPTTSRRRCRRRAKLHQRATWCSITPSPPLSGPDPGQRPRECAEGLAIVAANDDEVVVTLAHRLGCELQALALGEVDGGQLRPEAHRADLV